MSNFQWEKIESKKDAIYCIVENVKRIDLKNLDISGKNFEKELDSHMEEFFKYMEFDEIMKEYVNAILNSIENNKASNEIKVQYFEYFCNTFWGNYGIDGIKQCSNREKMCKISQNLFDYSSFEFKEDIAEYIEEDKKINFLDSYFEYIDPIRKIEIIESLNDDDKKAEEMKKMDLSIIDKIEMVKSFKRDKEKVQILLEIISSCSIDKEFEKNIDIYMQDFSEIFSMLKDKKSIEKIVHSFFSAEKMKNIFIERHELLAGLILKKIPDDMLTLRLVSELKNYGIIFTIDEIISSIKTYEGAKIIADSFKLTEGQMVALSYSIEDDEIQNKWVNEKTKLIEKLSRIATKVYSENEMKLMKKLFIGIELEAEGINYKNVKKIVAQMPVKKHIWTEWNIDRDGSLGNGTEIISPILDNSENSMNELRYICDFMNTIGLYTSSSCGGHIHFDSGILGKNVKAWENLITIWNEAEEIFFKMSNDVGNVPRKTINIYAKKESSNILSIYPDGCIRLKSEKDLEKLVKKMTPDRYYGINLSNLGNLKNTIEFRLPNGTINYRVVRENIKLFGSLLIIAKELTNGEEKLYKKFEYFKRHNISEALKVEALLDILFEKEEDKQIYRNRWDSVKDFKVFDNVKSKVPTFVRGDYSKIDNSKVGGCTNKIEKKDEEEFYDR